MRAGIRKGLIAANAGFDGTIDARAKLEPKLGLKEPASKLPLGLLTKVATITTRVKVFTSGSAEITAATTTIAIIAIIG